MESFDKKNITKSGYLTMVWACIFGGLILYSILVYVFMMGYEKTYTPYFMPLALAVVGFGIGLSYSRVYNIEGLDY